MDVDFNNLRKRMILDYNTLVNGLNTASVVIPLHKFGYIKKHLEDLKTDLITLGCCYEEGNQDCKCILDGGGLELNDYSPQGETDDRL